MPVIKKQIHVERKPIDCNNTVNVNENFQEK